ncbi:hypothetical protein J7E88_32870 [Streptomyces sp. ISL-10]|uniref:hypothetical protein n=1 Tax=Streptomyces sp. ISL-10 TaxID=2819172 RepID=UPI001BE94847|nr:hypothetical protein [Streptomyces sp. ISL-10]MBT2369936.1 hypothetical protein [Streptomyces sp. ISL-10]
MGTVDCFGLLVRRRKLSAPVLLTIDQPQLLLDLSSLLVGVLLVFARGLARPVHCLGRGSLGCHLLDQARPCASPLADWRCRRLAQL